MTAHMPTPSELRSCSWNYLHWGDRWCHDCGLTHQGNEYRKKNAESWGLQHGGKSLQFRGGRGSLLEWEITEHWGGRMTRKMSAGRSHDKSFKKNVIVHSVKCDWGIMEELTVIRKLGTSLCSSSSRSFIKILHWTIQFYSTSIYWPAY